MGMAAEVMGHVKYLSDGTTEQMVGFAAVLTATKEKRNNCQRKVTMRKYNV